jgi:hypothetical protein
MLAPPPPPPPLPPSRASAAETKISGVTIATAIKAFLMMLIPGSPIERPA